MAAGFVTVGADNKLPAAVQGELNATFASKITGSGTIVLGDSIDQGSDSERVLGGSIFSRLCVESNQRVTFVRNSGIGGNTTTTALSRIQADVVDHNPDIAIVGGGVTNDHGTGVDEATTRANILEMVRILRANGIAPVLRNCPPVDVAGQDEFNTVALRRAAGQRHNSWLRLWAVSESIPLLDYYTPMADPATGGYVAGYSTDGVHPTFESNRVVVESVIADLPAIFLGVPSLTAAKVDAGNLLTNGVFLGDSNADGTADSWIPVGGGITTALAADPAIVGNWQEITCDGTLGYIQQSVPDTEFNIGDELIFAGRVDHQGTVEATIKIEFVSASMSFIPVSSQTHILSGVFRMAATVPTGTTALKVQVSVNNAVGTVRVGQFSVTNRTALGL